MMNQQPIHILNQMGVIPSFSLATKVTEHDVTKLYNKERRAGKTQAEIEEFLRNKIIDEIQNALAKQQIPGLLNPQEIAEEAGLSKKIVRNIPELNRLVMVVAHKLIEKKFDKMSMCYLINGLVNMIGLTESDFEKFHRQNNKNNEEDDD
jgi:hypothetical protein